MIKVLENPLYYLDNFQIVLSLIESRYDDLLTVEERAFIHQFPVLPQAARALFVRMVMRKGEVFRASKLNYSEIGSTVDAALPLIELAWLSNDPVLDLDQLFEILLKDEIASVFKLSPSEKKLLKADQLDLLRARHPEQQHFSAWMGVLKDQTYQVLNKTLCDRLRLIFFGNFHQSWSEFVLSELGIYQYEKVEFSSSSRGFRSRQDIDDYLALQQCRERFHAEESIPEVLLELAGTATDNGWLAGRRHKLLFQIGEVLEKTKDWDLAFEVYSSCEYPGARLRSVRVLEKNGQSDAASALLKVAMAAPESDAEFQQLQRIAPRLHRKLGLPKLATIPNIPVDRLDLCLPFPDAPCYVEGVVRDHLTQADAPVFYVENALINSLFGLLCWRAIFHAIPGAFFHPFHRGPADLHSADFRQRRADVFAECLAELESDAYLTTIRRTYAEKQGIQSPFVAWQVLDAELLEHALSCIPARHLLHWCERILLDIKANRNGFPDLIQFWPEQKRYQMIEVKGPGDRLQDNQKRWIDFCSTHQMPISVCYLSWNEEAA